MATSITQKFNKIKKSYRIKNYGDYYHSLTRGYANCLMIYWDNSLDLLTVTLFDKVAVVADDIRYEAVTVPDPDEYLGEKAELLYVEDINPFYCYLFSGNRFPEKKLDRYIQLLESGYDLLVANVLYEEEENWWTYLICNENEELCIEISFSKEENGEYGMWVLLYADYCKPESSKEWEAEEEIPKTGKTENGILYLPTPEEFFGNLVDETHKDNKSGYSFNMCEYDEDLVEDYIEMLVEDYGLKLKKSYRIKDYGDYYHSLTKGYANCVMIYWDKSMDLLTVTFFDKVAQVG